MQLDMFLPEAITDLQDKFEKCERTATQVRKGLFARNTSLEKDICQIHDILKEMQRDIYNLKKKVHSQEEEIPDYIKVMQG